MMQGIHAMLVTPFTPDGALDLASLRRLVDFNAAAGVHGLVVLGVLGEAQKLADDERRAVVETAAEAAAARGLWLSVGVSHGGAAVAARFARQAEEAGAAAVLLAPPAGIAGGAALLAFIEHVALAISIPIVLQDYPPATGVTLPLPLLAQIAEQLPTVRALKCEDAPVPQKMTALRQLLGERFALLGGLGGLYLLEELRRGAAGTMTGFAYPEVLRAIYDAHQAGDQQRALTLFAAFSPLLRFEAQPVIGLGIRKALLQRRGAIANASLRLPYAPLDAATLAELDLWLQYLHERGLLDARGEPLLDAGNALTASPQQVDRQGEAEPIRHYTGERRSHGLP